MAYTPPNGSAANFTALGYYEPGAIRHAFRFPAETFTAPNGNAANFVLPWFIYPGASEVDFAELPSGPVQTVEGTGAVTVEMSAAGDGTVPISEVDGTGTTTIDFVVDGAGAHGVAGSGDAAIDVSASGASAHGVAGSGDTSISMSVTGEGVVERYELTGEVRLQGILVNRLVRAYRRDTGELVGELNTTAGRFKIPVGFVAREHYLIPVDTSNEATDWAPPCANRVMSVLAMDVA